MDRFRLAISLGLLLAMTPLPAQADRVNIQVGGLPAIVTDDASSYARRIEPGSTAGLQPGQPADVPADTYVDPPPPELTLSPGPAESLSQPPAPTLSPTRPGSLLDDDHSAPATAQTTGFSQQLADQGVTDPADLQAIWELFQREPATLSEADRVSNAVLRWMQETGRSPAGTTPTAPDVMKPDALRATIKPIKNGLTARSEPWGESNGPALPAGATVDLIPPASDGWYRVAPPSGQGWIPGVWLDFP